MRNIVLIFILCASCAFFAAQTLQRKYKAMLYCYLPAVNTKNNTQEFLRLARQINNQLRLRDINVQVSVCNEQESNYLYDAQNIDKLFETYDIVELDVSYLWAIKTNLLELERSEIHYFDNIFPFQWAPLARKEDGKQVYVGSPGLLCSTFVEQRQDDEYQNRLYAKFNAGSAFGLVDLYMNTFVNLQTDRTIESIDFKSVDNMTIDAMAQFLKDCQSDNSRFDFKSNWCLNKTGSFFATNYSKTVGYSQNLFNFINHNITEDYIAIKHIVDGRQKKIFYVDSFVAREDVQRDVALEFFEFMVSDRILDIYIKGRYTNKPHLTYLIPPTRSYLKKISRENEVYRSIASSAFKDTIQLPLYQKEFAENVYTFAALINNTLSQIGTQHSHLTLRKHE